MSTTLAFTPWARLGLGAAITAQPGALRATVPIKAQVTGFIGAAAAPPVDVPSLTAETLGPGDVLAIDPRLVIRTEPGPYAQAVPQHTLVSIEFSRPDFPWMFSPLAPDAQQRIQPWLFLLVIPQRPGITLKSRGGGLQVLTIDSANELPDLAESWAWAHAQTLSDDGQPTVSADEPRSLSRLVSPRRLDGATNYWACVVPTFNVGRQIGLDPSASPSGPLAPAWASATAFPLDLPVYYAWSFATGGAGDFHDLVARLQAHPIAADAGWRPLSIGFPTSPAPNNFAPFTAPLEGALRNLADPPAPDNASAAILAGNEITRLVNLPGVIAPPNYGQMQATAPAPWVDDLNRSPTARIAAATGARVVQAHQEELMAAAWDQVADMQRANQQRRQAHVALAVGDTLMQRHVQRMPRLRMLQVSEPSGLPTSGGANATTAVLGITPSTLSPVFRRLQRPAGSLPRRAAAAQGVLGSPATVGSFGMSILPRASLLLASAAAVNAKNPPQVSVFPEGDGEPSGSAPARASYKWTGRVLPTRTNPRGFTITRFTGAFNSSVPWRLDDGSQFANDARRQSVAAAFKAAAASVQSYLIDGVLPRAYGMTFHSLTPPPQVQEAAVSRVVTGMSPMRALTTRVAEATSPGGRIIRPFAARSDATPADAPGAAVLTTERYDPDFPQGMYRALSEVAPDLFFVGADRLPDNSVGLVRTNARFIESYLAGLNHELGREFLWRGFPSDGRGTYFRRFWDGDDYPMLRDWRGALGANRPSADWIVLLIRGELVRRYPRTTVYAQRGALDASGTQFVAASEPRRYPQFRVTLRGDLLCVGFDLTRAQATSYFFGIEEPMTEPRFAGPTTGAGAHVKVSDLSLRTDAHAGDVAVATLRRPVRVLVDPQVLIQ